jgi:hypothetical protein
MYKIFIRLDEPIFNALIKAAQAEKRGTREQAEVLLIRALGLPFPPTPPSPQKEAAHERQPA